MKRALIAPVAILAAACATTALADETGGEDVDVRAAMVSGINTAALAIWEIGNDALGEHGELDPARMDDADWARLREAAQTMTLYSHRLATAGEICASGPDLVGGKVPEGVASREQIQAMIDADPAGFRALSDELAREGEAFAEAAENRDTSAAGNLVLTFDAPCQTCHERYWFLQNED